MVLKEEIISICTLSSKPSFLRRKRKISTQADVTRYTLNGSCPSSSSTSSTPNAGAIAGGVVGGIAAVLLLGLAFFLTRRRKRRHVTSVANAVPFSEHRSAPLLADPAPVQRNIPQVATTDTSSHLVLGSGSTGYITSSPSTSNLTESAGVGKFAASNAYPDLPSTPLTSTATPSSNGRHAVRSRTPYNGSSTHLPPLAPSRPVEPSNDAEDPPPLYSSGR